ncbi:MAG: endonuclease domain-containing protein, partial [Anaerolineae bacterium]|nr:endonuclease domain-containing protein [Anaerolineae bacterium]
PIVLAARQLRRQMTPTEEILWQHLRDGRLDGIKFRRQHPYGPFILDFFCVEQQLVIEIDGSIHQQREQQARDRARDEYLEQNGLRILRFEADEVERDLPGVLNRIREACGLTPPPDPLPTTGPGGGGGGGGGGAPPRAGWVRGGVGGGGGGGGRGGGAPRAPVWCGVGVPPTGAGEG